MKKLVRVFLIATAFIGCIRVEQSVVVVQKKVLRINLNTASSTELKELRGIGEKKAQKIIRNRPYKDKYELLEREVIGKTTFYNIKEEISAYERAKPNSRHFEYPRKQY